MLTSTPAATAGSSTLGTSSAPTAVPAKDTQVSEIKPSIPLGPEGPGPSVPPLPTAVTSAPSTPQPQASAPNTSEPTRPAAAIGSNHAGQYPSTPGAGPSRPQPLDPWVAARPSRKRRWASMCLGEDEQRCMESTSLGYHLALAQDQLDTGYSTHDQSAFKSMEDVVTRLLPWHIWQIHDSELEGQTLPPDKAEVRENKEMKEASELYQRVADVHKRFGRARQREGLHPSHLPSLIKLVDESASIIREEVHVVQTDLKRVRAEWEGIQAEQRAKEKARQAEVAAKQAAILAAQLKPPAAAPAPAPISKPAAPIPAKPTASIATPARPPVATPVAAQGTPGHPPSTRGKRGRPRGGVGRPVAGLREGLPSTPTPNTTAGPSQPQTPTVAKTAGVAKSAVAAASIPKPAVPVPANAVTAASKPAPAPAGKPNAIAPVPVAIKTATTATTATATTTANAPATSAAHSTSAPAPGTGTPALTSFSSNPQQKDTVKITIGSNIAAQFASIGILVYPPKPDAPKTPLPASILQQHPEKDAITVVLKMRECTQNQLRSLVKILNLQLGPEATTKLDKSAAAEKQKQDHVQKPEAQNGDTSAQNGA